MCIVSKKFSAFFVFIVDVYIVFSMVFHLVVLALVSVSVHFFSLLLFPANFIFLLLFVSPTIEYCIIYLSYEKWWSVAFHLKIFFCRQELTFNCQYCCSDYLKTKDFEMMNFFLFEMVNHMLRFRFSFSSFALLMLCNYMC